LNFFATTCDSDRTVVEQKVQVIVALN